MSDAEFITAAFISFFVLLAILVFLRLLLRKGPPHWKQLRLGVYIERVPSYEQEEFEEETPEKPKQWAAGPYGDGPPEKP